MSRLKYDIPVKTERSRLVLSVLLSISFPGLALKIPLPRFRNPGWVGSGHVPTGFLAVVTNKIIEHVRLF